MSTTKLKPLIFLVILLALGKTTAQEQIPQASIVPQEKMALLSSLLGKWNMTVSVTNDNGKTWQHMPETAVELQRRQKGLMISEIPLDTDSPGFHMETHLTYDQYRKVYRKAAIDDFWGVMDIYEGNIRDNKLILTNLHSKTFFPAENDKWLAFKLEMELKKDQRTMDIFNSTDEGKTWQPAFKVTYVRQ